VDTDVALVLGGAPGKQDETGDDYMAHGVLLKVGKSIRSGMSKASEKRTLSSRYVTPTHPRIKQRRVRP